jgi:hypothetical protein
MNPKNKAKQAALLAVVLSTTLLALDLFGDDPAAWKVSGYPASVPVAK